MKVMPVGEFKTNCLAVMDEVKAKRVIVVITKTAGQWLNWSPLLRSRTTFLASIRARAPSLVTWSLQFFHPADRITGATAEVEGPGK